MTELDSLVARIKGLTPADKLRLAADLLENERPLLAHRIAEGVVLELGMALTRNDLQKRNTK